MLTFICACLVFPLWCNRTVNRLLLLGFGRCAFGLRRWMYRSYGFDSGRLLRAALGVRPRGLRRGLLVMVECTSPLLGCCHLELTSFSFGMMRHCLSGTSVILDRLAYFAPTHPRYFPGTFVRWFTKGGPGFEGHVHCHSLGHCGVAFGPLRGMILILGCRTALPLGRVSDCGVFRLRMVHYVRLTVRGLHGKLLLRRRNPLVVHLLFRHHLGRGRMGNGHILRSFIWVPMRDILYGGADVHRHGGDGVVGRMMKMIRIRSVLTDQRVWGG